MHVCLACFIFQTLFLGVVGNITPPRQLGLQEGWISLSILSLMGNCTVLAL